MSEEKSKEELDKEKEFGWQVVVILLGAMAMISLVTWVLFGQCPPCLR